MTFPVIAFIGAGNMASSIIGGLIANQYPPDKLWASNPDEQQLNFLKNTFAIHTTDDNCKAVLEANIVILAVKPQALFTVLSEIKPILQQRKPLLISIITGIKLETIAKWTGNDTLGIVRTMPNTPALLRCGISGLSANANVTSKQREMAESILRAVGMTIWFDQEEKLDAVTAISGSGPAYFFLIMEIMVNSAKEMGLSEQEAEALTINTALGAARLALESGKDVATLRRQVTSPGGTTQQAIEVLEAGNIHKLFNSALNAAKNKAHELSQLLDEQHAKDP
jgi:pyrroline-5-carboxylate reductase